MTLEQYMGILPETHPAKKEFRALEAEITRLEASLRDCKQLKDSDNVYVKKLEARVKEVEEQRNYTQERWDDSRKNCQALEAELERQNTEYVKIMGEATAELTRNVATIFDLRKHADKLAAALERVLNWNSADEQTAISLNKPTDRSHFVCRRQVVTETLAEHENLKKP